MKTKKARQELSILYAGARSMLVNKDIFNKKSVINIPPKVNVKNYTHIKKFH